MNIYFIGMCAAMVIFIIIGIVIGRKIRNSSDFYVAGRAAPVLLVAGSIVASYASTGLFMGDAAEAYLGVFGPMVVLDVGLAAGYFLGGAFFGRYLRRSRALTIPDFFGKRFDSKPVRILSAITAIVMMTVYLLSVMTGIGTLMNSVTGVSYTLCILIATVVFVFISVVSGSRGVLVTDTLMAVIFTVSLIIAAIAIPQSTGGWFATVRDIAATDPELLSWSGKVGELYDTGGKNFIFVFFSLIIWVSVTMVGPWQSSRYQMAKSEHIVSRSTVFAVLGVAVIEFLALMAGAFVYHLNPNLEDSAQCLIWASMNVLPVWLGVLLLTGVLSAGISSATTFLSLIGASFANDIFCAEEKRSIRIGQIAMIVIAVLVFGLTQVNSTSIYWIMYLGGSIVVSSWMPVAVASIFSKRATKKGVFTGMLIGFIVCFALRLMTSLTELTLPFWLDASILGMLCNILTMVIVSAMGKPTDTEIARREALFVMPEAEKDPNEMRLTLKNARFGIAVGIFVTVLFLVLWVIPYLQGLIK